MIYPVFSNRFEILYEELKRELYQRQTFFSIPTIVVPSFSVKAYLIQRLAEDNEAKALFAVNITLAEQAIEKFLAIQFPTALDFEIITQDPKIAALFTKWSWFGKEEEGLFESAFQKKTRSLWQQFLDDKPNWVLPEKEMNRLSATSSRQVYLFGFSYFPKALYSYFNMQSHEIHLYLLSPCMLFWEDILSDKEAWKVETGVNKKYEELLFDRNPLLANLGSIGRKFAATVEESAVQGREAYCLIECFAEHPAYKEFIQEKVLLGEGEHCLLHALQSDLLLLQGKREEKIKIEAEDTSIQIHSVPTALREIEVLYHTLSSLSFEEFSPGDIVVVAPDIHRYAPYIDRFFGASSSLFTYQIIDSTLSSSCSSFCRTLLHIFTLPEERYSAKAFFDLFLCPAFRARMGVESDDISSIQRLFIEGGFREGFHAKQRRELFKEHGICSLDENGTWRNLEENFLKMWTQGDLEATSSQILGSAIACIRSLFQEIEAVSQKDESSLDEWILFLEKLVETYFVMQVVEKNEIDLYRKICMILRDLSKRNETASLTFSSMRSLLENAFKEALQEKESRIFIQKEIIFTSLEQLHLPAKVVCLIGMNAEEFPRQERFEEDKYSIIQAILAARKTLYISYQGFSFADHAVIAPAQPIAELMDAISVGYLLSNKLVTTHPLIPQILRPFKNDAAAPSTLFDFSIATPIEEVEAVDLHLLRQVAKSPLKPYFQNTFQLSLSSFKEERLSKLIERFDIYRLEKNSLKYTLEDFLLHVEEHPKMPTGMLKKALIKHIEESRKRLEEIATALDVGAPLTIELSSNCLSPTEIAKNHYIFPALTIDKKTLTGKLEGVYEGGYLLFEQSNISSFFRAWPDLIVYECLREKYGNFAGTCGKIISLKDAKKETFTLANPHDELNKFSSYVDECHSKPYGLYPDWLPEILKGNLPSESWDPYATFFLKKAGDEAITKLLPEWKAKAEELLKEILHV
ncbi:MAG: recC [Chlamydiia bacterium]|nr:recC [Chlamydiia bacterium]